MELRGIGLELEEKDSYDSFRLVTQPIEIENYDWFVKDLDVYANIQQNASVELGGIITGKVLSSQSQNFNYCIFGKFIAYPTLTTKRFDISSYEDFLVSNAFIIILVWDVYYYDIYCKDIRLTHSLASNAEKYGFLFEYIDKNYPRVKLDVW